MSMLASTSRMPLVHRLRDLNPAPQHTRPTRNPLQVTSICRNSVRNCLGVLDPRADVDVLDVVALGVVVDVVGDAGLASKAIK